MREPEYLREAAAEAVHSGSLQNQTSLRLSALVQIENDRRFSAPVKAMIY